MSTHPVAEYLATLSRFHQEKREGWRYSSYEELVLEQGQAWEPAPLPPSIEHGVPKECFSNALLLAVARPDLTYVEGWATSIIPVAHAWCVDYNGLVVDPTWVDSDLERAYYGVAFDTTTALTIVTETGYYGIFGNDWKRDFELLKNGLPNED